MTSVGSRARRVSLSGPPAAGPGRLPLCMNAKSRSCDDRAAPPWRAVLGCLDAWVAVGEQAGRTGEEGARRAKRWLDATTRVGQSWTNEDTVAAGKLEFAWPFGGQTFSFDLGGVLRGDPYHNHHFVAESKKYAAPADQGTRYDNWVAKCYVVRATTPALADQFMWITWAPFRMGEWLNLLKEVAIRQGLLTDKNIQRVFDTDDKRLRSG